MSLNSFRFAYIAEGHRRLESGADYPAERLHWQFEAERFEELSRLAWADPAEAQRRYLPTVAWNPETMCPHNDLAEAGDQITCRDCGYEA